MSDFQFLKPTIVPPPPSPPIETFFGSYQLVLPFDVNNSAKAGMLWLREEKVDGKTIVVPEYISNDVVYPIERYVDDSSRHYTLWRIHVAGQNVCNDAILSNAALYSSATTVRKMGDFGVSILEERHFSKFTEFLRIQLCRVSGAMEVRRITDVSHRR